MLQASSVPTTRPAPLQQPPYLRILEVRVGDRLVRPAEADIHREGRA